MQSELLLYFMFLLVELIGLVYYQVIQSACFSVQQHAIINYEV